MMKRIYIIAFMLLSLFVVSACSNDKSGNNDNTADNNVDSLTVKPIELTKHDFIQKVADYKTAEWKYLGDKPCIIDFWASWCPPCRLIAPILDELAKEYDGQIYVYKVNVDKESELATAYNVSSIPTLLFVPMNGEPFVEVGALSKNQLKEKIEHLLLDKK